MVPRHHLLEARAEQVVVPVAERQKLLERAGWDLRQVGHWLDALARQVAELAFDIISEMLARIAALEAIAKLVQVIRQGRT